MSGRRTGTDDDRYRTDGGREPEDVTDLEGIGPARADKLADAGFESVADLRGASRDDLVDVLGPDLADRVLGQLRSDPPGEETSAADTESSVDDGPTVPPADEPGDSDDSGPDVPDDSDDSGPAVPPADEPGDSDDSGPDVPDDSGPSVPPGSGDGSDAGAEPGGQAGRDSSQGGQAGGGSAGTPTTGTGGDGTVESTTRQGTASANDSNEDAILAGLVSFLIPGVGNMINGQTDRGVIILVLWILWLIVGWGIGLFIVGSVLAVFTFGIGFLLVGFVVGLMEFLIHVLAAVDAYRGSKVVDNVAGKVNQVRGN